MLSTYLVLFFGRALAQLQKETKSLWCDDFDIPPKQEK